jgi:two-component system, NarL family, response regulator NreC
VSRIRVLIVDDHPILSEGLRSLLSAQEDMEVVGLAQNGEQGITCVSELHPDVVVMDIAMPGMNGIQATQVIRERYPETRVLILTQREDGQYVIPLLRMGASGIVLKRALVSDLVAALRAVAQGESFLYPTVASAVVEKIKERAELPRGTITALTPRERQVLERIIMGEKNAEIASVLSVSVKTVEFHRANLMSKFGVHCVVDLVREALRQHIVDDCS